MTDIRDSDALESPCPVLSCVGGHRGVRATPAPRTHTRRPGTALVPLAGKSLHDSSTNRLALRGGKHRPRAGFVAACRPRLRAEGGFDCSGLVDFALAAAGDSSGSGCSEWAWARPEQELDRGGRQRAKNRQKAMPSTIVPTRLKRVTTSPADMRRTVSISPVASWLRAAGCAPNGCVHLWPAGRAGWVRRVT
jgi:hypothetical protein